ncbi:hypothetical protein HNR30_007348 [Nonomuraea soli]|uniref:Clp R domain-containing protein n=1 Tax=Nonomuraea soli TaxID=1032476 RepID=A0A7W0HUG9_9ACTN|nr:hypothetical protein [Nonomuraea soli]
MFERFTDRARRVVVLAQEEARLLNHNYIGTEHILLGLVNESEGVAGRALSQCRIDLGQVREGVQEIVGMGDRPPGGHIPFTPRAKKVLELSLREALQLGHNYIGTEHILLGLIREGEGVAAQVLVRYGADLNRIRQVVVTLLHGRPQRHDDDPPLDLSSPLPPHPAHPPPPPGIGSRGPGLIDRLDRLQSSLDRLEGSVERIERHLGIERPPAPEDAPLDRPTEGPPTDPPTPEQGGSDEGESNAGGSDEDRSDEGRSDEGRDAGHG